MRLGPTKLKFAAKITGAALAFEPASGGAISPLMRQELAFAALAGAGDAPAWASGPRPSIMFGAGTQNESPFAEVCDSDEARFDPGSAFRKIQKNRPERGSDIGDGGGGHRRNDYAQDEASAHGARLSPLPHTGE
jgi:hypothetical protein